MGAPSPRVFASSCALCTVSARNAGTGAQDQLSCTPEARATGPPSRPMTVWAWPCWPRESSCGHCWFTGGHRFVQLWPHVSLLKLASHFRHPGARPQQWPPYCNPWSLWPLVSGHWWTTSCTDVLRHRTVARASAAVRPAERAYGRPARSCAARHAAAVRSGRRATRSAPTPRGPVHVRAADAGVAGPRRAWSAGIRGGLAGRARVGTRGTTLRGSLGRRSAKGPARSPGSVVLWPLLHGCIRNSGHC